METLILPESWNDLDMNWDDPDPSKSCYYDAIFAAAGERMRAMSLSGARWYQPCIYSRKRTHIPSAGMIQSLAGHIFSLLAEKGSIILARNKFFGEHPDLTIPPPSMKNQITPWMTYPVIVRSEPLAYAKEFLIWAKKTLDTMTLFGNPFVKIDYYHPGEFGVISDSFWTRPELEDVEDERERLEIAASLFIRKHSGDVTIKSDVFQTFDLRLRTYCDASNAHAEIEIKLPESVVVRSFARPHIYCLIKTKPQFEAYKWYYSDFGYGFEENTGTILDLGQLPDEKDKKIQLFQFQLERIRSDICAGDGVHHNFEAACYFALDYNVEGGFKFRPDDK